MPFKSYADIDPTKVQTGNLRNIISVSPVAPVVAGQWFDDSVLPGFPSANPYAGAPNTASVLLESRGIQHWELESGESEHLLEWFMHTAVSSTLDAPYSMVLCDYTMFYPQIDCNITSVQTMDNTISLPRHGNGEGLRAFIVSTNGGSANAGEYEIIYTNSEGVTNRVSQGVTAPCLTAGQIMTNGLVSAGAINQHAPFIWTAPGCTGIKQIDSIRWISPPGGRAAIVFVRTIASISNVEPNSIAEAQYFERMPEIPRGAYLGILRNAGTATPYGTLLFGQITTIKS